jgi:hypothetical protein
VHSIEKNMKIITKPTFLIFVALNLCIATYALYVYKGDARILSSSDPTYKQVEGVVERSAWSGKHDQFAPLYKQEVMIEDNWYFLASKEKTVVMVGDRIVVYLPELFIQENSKSFLLSFDTLRDKPCIVRLNTRDGGMKNVSCDNDDK